MANDIPVSLSQHPKPLASPPEEQSLGVICALKYLKPVAFPGSGIFPWRGAYSITKWQVSVLQSQNVAMRLIYAPAVVSR